MSSTHYGDSDQALLDQGKGTGELFQQFFGRLPKGRRRADDELPHETFNLPDAYKGKNHHLEDVLDFMIRREDEFYTTRLLPWFYTDDIHVEWEIFRFNRTLMDVEPEQGIPRLVTAETERRTDNLLRRGLAFIIEHGFMTTERGRKHFMLNLQQITDAVHTTAHFGVMHALLTSRQHYPKWRRENDRLAKRPRNYMKHERDTWAIVQKSHKGLHILDAELKHEMKRNGVTPNIWVFPAKMSIYLDMVPKEATDYMHKGQLALGNLEEDRTEQHFSGIRWRGCDVFEAQSFDIDFDHRDTDLMNRARQCGEFFVIPWGTRSIKIFSADHDDLKDISFSEASEMALNSRTKDVDQFFPTHHTRRDHMALPGTTLESLKKLKSLLVSELSTRIVKDTTKDTKSRKKFTSPVDINSFATNDDVDDKLDSLLGFYNAITDALRLNSSTYEILKEINSGKTNLFGDAERDNNNNVIEPESVLHYVLRGAICIKDLTKLQDLMGGGAEFTGSIDALIAAILSRPQLIPAAAKQIADEIVKINKVIERKKDFLEGKDKTLKTKGNDDQDALKTQIDEIGAEIKKLTGLWTVLEIIRLACERGIPHDVIIFRPFQTYRMSSAILAAGGEDLGSTFHGHHDFQLSDDIIRKVHVGHYTHYSKSVVKQPKRFSIADDVFAQGYVSGEGIEFFDEDSLADNVEHLGMKENTRSLIAWNVSAGSARDMIACDMRGKFANSDYDHGEEEHFEDASLLKAILVRAGILPRHDGGHDQFLNDLSPHNTACFRGMQYNRVSGVQEVSKSGGGLDRIYKPDEFVCSSLSHGHWKGLTFPGCMGVREGVMMSSDYKQPSLGDRA